MTHAGTLTSRIAGPPSSGREKGKGKRGHPSLRTNVPLACPSDRRNPWAVFTGSDEFGELPQGRGGLRQTLPLQRLQILRNALRRILQALPLALGCGADDVRRQVELRRHE